MSKINISFNVTTTSNIILVARLKSDPLSSVFSQFYSAPHSVRNIVIDNLAPAMHIVQIWTTVDGTTLQTLIGQCEIDSSLSSSSAVNVITFVVDRGLTGAPNYDPVAPTNTYTNPTLDGTTYVVFKPGFGPLQFGTHIQTVTGGGFKFVDGDVFNTGEEYTILQSITVQSITQGSGLAYPQDIVMLAGDIALDSTIYNKMLIATGAGPIITVSIANINTPPDNTKFGINTMAASCKYVVVQLPVGVTVNINGKNRNAIYIGKGEVIHFQKKSGVLYIIDWAGDYRRVGEEVFKGGTAPINSVPQTGGWYLKTSELRLWNWYTSELPGAEVQSVADDSTVPIPSMWAAGTNKFWVPNVGGYFIRAADPAGATDAIRTAGNMQGDTVGPHTHDIPIATTPGGGPAGGRSNTLGANTQTIAQTPGFTTETRPKNIAKNSYIIT